MAQPIRLNLPHRDPREALHQRLEHAPQEHVEALLATYDILQGLHDRGILELLRGVLGSSEQVLEMVVDAANTPPVIRGIRNLLIMAKLADSIDPALLEGLAQAVAEALAQSKESKPMGLMQLMKKLNSQDSRRVLGASAAILESLGKGLGSLDAAR